jgi:NTP pyrophosphatase (non-canonical NTP hydrolase)
MQEELGELSHSFLKYTQGIRGYDYPKFETKAKDALGDLFVYMMSFCNTLGWSLADIVEEVWSSVSERNWIDHPETGHGKET